MGTRIQFKSVATKCGFGRAGNTCHGHILHNESLGIDEIAKEFAQLSGKCVPEAKMYTEFFADYIMKALGEGKRLDFGGFALFLSMTGKIDGLNGGFKAGKNSIIANILAKPQLKDALSQLEPVNISSEGRHVTVQSVIDEVHREEDVIVFGAKVFAAGATFLIDTSRDDEGVWLERENGEKVARAKVLASTSTTLDCEFEGAAPAPGAYRFAVYTRMGDPSLPSPAHSRRKVTLVA